MPEPTGAELERVRARRQQLRERYLRPLGDRPPSTVQGVHHLALICQDAEELLVELDGLLGVLADQGEVVDPLHRAWRPVAERTQVALA